MQLINYSTKCIQNIFYTNITMSETLSTLTICTHDLFSPLLNTKLWTKTIKYSLELQKKKIFP